MKSFGNSREIFLKTLDKRAHKKVQKKDPITGKIKLVNEVANYDMALLFKKAMNGEVKLQDVSYVITRYVSGEQTIDMIRQDEARKTGLRSIANAALKEGEYFCPTSITVQAATCASSSDDDVASAIYGVIDTKAVLSSGEISLTANEAEQVLNEEPLSKYTGLTQGNADAPAGTLPLDNPTIFMPKQRIKLEAKFSVQVPAADKIALRVILHGTRTAPKAA